MSDGNKLEGMLDFLVKDTAEVLAGDYAEAKRLAAQEEDFAWMIPVFEKVGPDKRVGSVRESSRGRRGVGSGGGSVEPGPASPLPMARL